MKGEKIKYKAKAILMLKCVKCKHEGYVKLYLTQDNKLLISETVEPPKPQDKVGELTYI